MRERLIKLEESSQVDAAGFAVTTGMQDEPAFPWWVAHALNKTRNGSTAHKKLMAGSAKVCKLEFEVPTRTIAGALRIKKENSNGC